MLFSRLLLSKFGNKSDIWTSALDNNRLKRLEALSNFARKQEVRYPTRRLSSLWRKFRHILHRLSLEQIPTHEFFQATRYKGRSLFASS